MTPKQSKKLEKFVQALVFEANQVESSMNAVSPFSIGVNLGIAAAANGILKNLGDKSFEKYNAPLSRAVKKQMASIQRYFLMDEKRKPSRSSKAR